MKRYGHACRYVFPLMGNVVLVLALASCGGNNADTSSARGHNPPPVANTSAATANTSGSSSVDACKLLTRPDATALFGKPASSQKPEMAPLPDQVGACQWGWVGSEETQQLSIKVMTNPGDHYFKVDNAPPLNLGDDSQLIIDETTMSINIYWVQNGNFFDLKYESNPFQKSKADALQSLAKKISGQI